MAAFTELFAAHLVRLQGCSSYNFLTLSWSDADDIQVMHEEASSWLLNITGVPTASPERATAVRWCQSRRLAIDADQSTEKSLVARIEGLSAGQVADCVMSFLAVSGATNEVLKSARWEVYCEAEAKRKAEVRDDGKWAMISGALVFAFASWFSVASLRHPSPSGFAVVSPIGVIAGLYYFIRGLIRYFENK